MNTLHTLTETHKTEGDTMAHTVKANILGDCAASGPCSFRSLVSSAIDQVQGLTSRYDTELQVVIAINELCREGRIELYETGDCWDASRVA